MLVTKFGHSCLLVEEGDARILIDPGDFSEGLESVGALDALLITHQHPDHLGRAQIEELLERVPQVQIYCDEQSVEYLAELPVEPEAVKAGDKLEVKGVWISVHGRDHAQVTSDIPGIANVGYLVAGRLFHPGDAFTEPVEGVEILALPVVAPWCKVSEVADYLKRVKPKVALPIHDKVTGMPELYYGILEPTYSALGVDFRPLGDGERTEI